MIPMVVASRWIWASTESTLLEALLPASVKTVPTPAPITVAAIPAMPTPLCPSQTKKGSRPSVETCNGVSPAGAPSFGGSTGGFSAESAGGGVVGGAAVEGAGGAGMGTGATIGAPPD